MKLKSTETELPAPGSAVVARRGFSLSSFLIKYNAILILVLMFIIATMTSPIFFTSNNLLTLFRQQVPYLIMAMGAMMVIITGGIDLSVSSIAAVSSIMVAYSVNNWGLNGGGFDTALAILIGIGFSLVFGAVNGFFIAYLKIPAFIVTLASMTAGQGIAYIITKGTTIMLRAGEPAYKWMVGFASAVDPLFKVPYAVYMALAIVVIFFFLMRGTTFGRLVYAVGSNETAVILAGINTKKIIFLVYLIAGALCGVAGAYITCRTGSATALTATGDYNMSIIAGVVIGGASLSGGEGTVVNTVIGVFIIAIITNIMNLVNFASYPQMVVKAAVIVLAVLLKSVSSKRG